jgi:hypothetical protein
MNSMRVHTFLRFAILSLLIATSACNQITRPTSIPLPTVAPIAPTATSVPATPTQSPTPLPTETITPTPTLTLIPAPTIIYPTATPIPAAAPGIYVTALDMRTTELKSNDLAQFTPTFLNTTGQPQTIRWFIKIFKSDQIPSFGETPKNTSTLPFGASQFQAESNWKTGTFFGCLWFSAGVFWVDDNNQVIELLKPDGKPLRKDFSVCP